jgi:hypothetical protein
MTALSPILRPCGWESTPLEGQLQAQRNSPNSRRPMSLLEVWQQGKSRIGIAPMRCVTLNYPTSFICSTNINSFDVSLFYDFKIRCRRKSSNIWFFSVCHTIRLRQADSPCWVHCKCQEGRRTMLHRRFLDIFPSMGQCGNVSML